MKNKLLIITFFAIVVLVNALLFLSAGGNREGGNDFLYKTLFFWLTGAAFLFSCAFLFSGIRKINDKILLPFVIIIAATAGVFLNFKYGGSFSENWLGLFREPLLWMLIATLIGHLVLLFYKRNKQQMN